MENKEIEIPEDIKAWILTEAGKIANEPVIHEFQAARVMGERLYRHLAQSGGCGENQQTIADWCGSAFGPAFDVRSIFARANKEMSELLMEAATGNNCQKEIEECADIVICLYRAVAYLGGDLNDAINKKMAKNRSRKWKLDGFGHGQHIEPPTHQ